MCRQKCRPTSYDAICVSTANLRSHFDAFPNTQRFLSSHRSATPDGESRRNVPGGDHRVAAVSRHQRHVSTRDVVSRDLYDDVDSALRSHFHAFGAPEEEGHRNVADGDHSPSACGATASMSVVKTQECRATTCDRIYMSNLPRWRKAFMGQPLCHTTGGIELYLR